MSMRVLAVLLMSALLTAPRPALAKDGGASAELVRLQDELEKLASRNQWNGVERTYGKVVKLQETEPDVQVPPEFHVIGAQAASQRGDITVAHRRLVRAVPGYKTAEAAAMSGPRATALQTIQTIEARYGHVKIKVSQDRVPALVRFEMPFTREERKAIEYGRTTLADTWELNGFLPVGRYMVDGQFFTVESGGEAQLITVGKDDG